ncbi:MAG: ATP-binding protein [Colwellia sp.]|nr:ATP-binding protein [Colwellia sp.]
MVLLYVYIQDTLVSLESKLKDASHAVTVNGPETLTLNSYPGAFYQLFSNLILNSIIHIFDSENKGEITITIEQTDETLHINYQDNRRGLTTQEQKKIFEPFYKTQRGSDGSGLGAHIIYNLITQRLTGEIELDQTIKTGFSLNMYLQLSTVKSISEN